MEFNNFPEELLVIIFDYVSAKDLRSLALVCKNFSYIVNNNTCLVEKFKVILNHKRVETRWIGSRKYEAFKIVGCNKAEFERYVGIFSRHGEHVKIMSLESNTFSLGSLKVLFVLCPNLKRVSLHQNSIDFSTDFPFVLRNLKAIDFVGETLSIEKFKMSNYLTTILLSGHQNYPEMHSERFLALQRRLTKLRLSDFSRNAFFFTSPNFHSLIQFRLQCLSLVNVDLPTNPRLFRYFLAHHKDTLSYLELGNLSFEILPYFNNFKKLKTIKFTSLYERNYLFVHDFDSTPMNYVENLVIDCQNVVNIAVKFPNLISLSIYRVKINPAEILRLQYLENLTIVESRNISNLEILNVRNIRFELCHFSGTKTLTNNRRFIEKLTIVNCKNVNWLNKFFDFEYLNLKHFELSGTQMSKKLYTKIISMERKMESCIVSSDQMMNDFQAFKQSVEICLEHFLKCVSCLCEPEF